VGQSHICGPIYPGQIVLLSSSDTGINTGCEWNWKSRKEEKREEEGNNHTVHAYRSKLHAATDRARPGGDRLGQLGEHKAEGVRFQCIRSTHVVLITFSTLILSKKRLNVSVGLFSLVSG
jgi:hypothetical protein